MPSKNIAAATLTRAQAEAQGVITASDPGEVAAVITSNTRKLFGFTRKVMPQGLPKEPKIYIYSVSEYGEIIDLGPGFTRYEVLPCPEGEDFGDPCEIPPVTIMEEAKVDVTEHTFFSGQDISNAILKIGPGMNAAWDKRNWGWFQSTSNPPTEAEVKQALNLYTKTCQRLLQEGNRYSSANKLDEINETHRRAARFLRQKVDWDKPQLKMVDCVSCGESIKAGAIIHAVPYCGAVQPGKWPEALANGAKSMADVDALPKPIRDEIMRSIRGANKEPEAGITT